MSVLGKILVKLGLDSSDFTRGTRDAQRQTQDFTGKISGMFGKLAGALGIGFSIKKAFDFGREAYQAAAQAKGVKIAFDRLNDPNLLANLKAATKGTVDELKLMQLSVQAKNFKLPVEQLGTYLKFATKRAQETGLSVDYLTNSIITGLGRKSVMILDNLGVSAVEIREEMKKGGDMAQAVGRIIQREMANSGDIVETATIKTEKINAKWSDFKGNLGNTSLIQKAGHAIQDFLIGVLNRLNDALTSVGNNEVQTWIGNVGIMEDAKKAEVLADKLKEINNEIAELEKLEPSNKFLKGMLNLEAHTKALHGVETSYARLGKLRNQRIAIHDLQKSDGLNKITDEYIATLQLKKKTETELLALLRNHSGESFMHSNVQVREAISEEIDLLSQRAAEAAEKAKDEAEKRAEEIRKSQLSYKETENIGAIAQLEKQNAAYGNTLGYMNAMLALQREREQYAKSDVEYRKIKTENDELEKQIKLRKEPTDYQKGSENDLKEQLSNAETEMGKLDGTTETGKQRMGELVTVAKNLRWQIENLPQNLPTTEKGQIDKQIADIRRLQDEISVGDGGAGDIAKAQKQFNDYQQSIDAMERKRKNAPKIEFAEGSTASYKQEIDGLMDGLDQLTGKEREAELAKIALLEAKSTGAESGFKTQLEQEESKLKTYTEALRTSSEEHKKYWAEMVRDQKNAVGELAADGQMLLDYGSVMQGYIQNTFSSIGDYLGDLADDGQADAALERVLIKPLADAAVSMGTMMISLGIAALQLQSLITNPWTAIAAGAALVVLGTVAGAMAQSAVNKSTSGGGSSGGGNTFTGGYSNGGSARTAQSLQLASPQSQVVVLETRVSGSDIILSQSREKQRRSR